MERLVDRAYATFGEEARRRGIDYERELDGKPVIVADGDRVLQIISNLLVERVPLDARRRPDRPRAAAGERHRARGRRGHRPGHLGGGARADLPAVLVARRRRHRARSGDRARARGRATAAGSSSRASPGGAAASSSCCRRRSRTPDRRSRGWAPWTRCRGFGALPLQTRHRFLDRLVAGRRLVTPCRAVSVMDTAEVASPGKAHSSRSGLASDAVTQPQRAEVFELPSRPPRRPLAAALAALRPRQWTKNLLLFAGIIFAAQPGRFDRALRGVRDLLRRLERRVPLQRPARPPARPPAPCQAAAAAAARRPPGARRRRARGPAHRRGTRRRSRARASRPRVPARLPGAPGRLQPRPQAPRARRRDGDRRAVRDPLGRGRRGGARAHLAVAPALHGAARALPRAREAPRRARPRRRAAHAGPPCARGLLARARRPARRRRRVLDRDLVLALHVHRARLARR